MALPSLKQLTYFVTLAQTRHFTEAAQQCYVTQSTLSGGVQELERIIGGVLFERTRHGVSLTMLGQQLLPRAQQLLADAKEMVQLAAELSEPLTGTLKIAIIPTIAPFIINRLVSAIHIKWPRLKLEILEQQSAVAVNELSKGDVDFVLLALPYDTQDFHSSVVLEDPLKLIVHEKFNIEPTIKSILAAHTWPKNRSALPVTKKEISTTKLQSLNFEHLLLLEEGHCLRDHTLQLCPSGTSASRGAYEASSLLTLVQLIQAKIGYGFLPQIALNAGLLSSNQGLVQITLEQDPIRQIALLTRRTSVRRYEHQQLSELLKNLFEENATI